MLSGIEVGRLVGGNERGGGGGEGRVGVQGATVAGNIFTVSYGGLRRFKVVSCGHRKGREFFVASVVQLFFFC